VVHDVAVTSPIPDDAAALFRRFHHARRRRRAPAIIALAFASGLVTSGVAVAAALPSAAASRPIAAPTVHTTSSELPSDSPSAAASPAPASPEAPAPAAAPAPETAAPAAAPAIAAAPVPLAIDVTATGYQTELDACQWVRMDLGASAPIVGAHTRCGGSVVLTLNPGDQVRIRGQGLDGSYRVVGSRDAWAGEDAASATSGMPGSVLLQTCYPSGNGRVRLVGLAAV
jgi:hypothetical protein